MNSLLINKLPIMSLDEKKVLLIFLLTVFAWVFRGQLNNVQLLSELTDAGIAISAAFLLFIIPSSNNKNELLCWDDMRQIPWGLILLFGGGLALAKSIMESGLASWIANNLEFLTDFSDITTVFILVFSVIFLTEILSNTALTISFLPIVSIVAVNLQLPVQLLGTIMVIAASCAFMLPIATPPNAVIFATEKIKVVDMVKVGFIMNIFTIFIITSVFSIF